MGLFPCVPLDSLHVVLQKPDCASINNLENIIENGQFCVVPFQRDRLQWIDERNEMISISFIFRWCL